MPLTDFQRAVLVELATGPSHGRYLAGGAAMHFAPQSLRYSDDLDFFHDSEQRVAESFAADRTHLTSMGYAVAVELALPGFVRAIVRLGDSATRVDWAHDSAWRFMPLQQAPFGGFLLSPIDLAINKLLALAGRDEPRDFVDILEVFATLLPLGPLCWAAVGKDPGLTPLSLLELLQRRGRYHPEDFGRLHLVRPFDLHAAKTTWLAALASAEAFVRTRPTDELGALYFDTAQQQFVTPVMDRPLSDQGIVPHYGAPGGVLPQIPGV